MEVKTNWRDGIYYYEFEHIYGRAKAHTLNNSEAILFIHSSSVNTQERGKGLGKAYHNTRLTWLRNQGKHKYLMCTCQIDNEAEVAILTRFDWDKLVELEDLDLCICFKKLGE